MLFHTQGIGLVKSHLGGEQEKVHSTNDCMQLSFLLWCWGTLAEDKLEPEGDVPKPPQLRAQCWAGDGEMFKASGTVEMHTRGGHSPG